MLKNTDPATSIKKFINILSALIEVHPQPLSIYDIIIKSGIDSITPNQLRMYQRIVKYWTQIGIIVKASMANTPAKYYYLSEAGEYFIGSLRSKENKRKFRECLKHKSRGQQSIDFRFLTIAYIAIENEPYEIDTNIVLEYIHSLGLKQCRRTWQRNLNVCINGGLIYQKSPNSSRFKYVKLDPVIKSTFFKNHKHPQIIKFEKVILQFGLCRNFHEYINYNELFFLNLWKAWYGCREKFYVMIENLVERKEVALID